MSRERVMHDAFAVADDRRRGVEGAAGGGEAAVPEAEVESS
jgi:hypothetical protein